MSSQQLPNLIKSPLREPLPPGYYIRSLLDIFSVALAFVVGMAYYWYLDGSLPAYVAPAAFIPFAILAIMQVFLGKGGGWRLIVILLEALVMVLPFFRTAPGLLVGVFTAVSVLLLRADLHARAEIEESTRVRFYRVAKSVANTTLIAVVLFMVAMYVSRASAQNLFLSEQSFNGVFRWTANEVKKYYPHIDLNSSVQQFASRMTDNELKKNEAFSSLSTEQQQKVFEKSVSGIIENMKVIFGPRINPDDNIARTAYLAIIERFENLQRRYGAWFLIAWAFLIMVIVHNVGFIVTLPTIFIAYLLYLALAGMRTFEIAQESTSQEKISFPLDQKKPPPVS
jgi:hypothetical protein